MWSILLFIQFTSARHIMNVTFDSLRDLPGYNNEYKESDYVPLSTVDKVSLVMILLFGLQCECFMTICI